MRLEAQMNQSVQTNFNGKMIKIHKFYEKIKCFICAHLCKELSWQGSYKYGQRTKQEQGEHVHFQAGTENCNRIQFRNITPSIRRG
jgi:succinate dehydrogenase/fumarate reductase-like Fe-S protein